MEKISAEVWAVGVDLGGTKVEVAQVDAEGKVYRRLRRPTAVTAGASAVCADIVEAVHELVREVERPPTGVGVGVAGQVSAGGIVYFAPNLKWKDVPLQADLSRAIGLNVAVTNDVRAATIGEWFYGAGRGHDDILCLFVGTGIGGGIVSGGRLLSGCSNNAGELGHMTLQMDGPPCHCGNHGCLEALAGGWAIARRAREAVAADRQAGAALLEMAGGAVERINGALVGRLYKEGNPLCRRLVEETGRALGAGAAGLVNAFNPSRLILGGGVIEGIPDLVAHVEKEVARRALRAASSHLEIVRATLHGDAGVVGAATLAMTSFA